MLADQVDRSDQRLCLDRQQPGGTVEVVAVGLRIDLDLALLLLDFRIQDIGAAAEVDDVQDVHVLAQLLLTELKALADLGDRHALPFAPGLDQDARQRHQPREALRADRGLAARALAVAVGVAGPPSGSRVRLLPALALLNAADLRPARV